MTGRFAVQKGKRAERAVAAVLNPILAKICATYQIDAWKLQRNLKQTQEGGFDLDGLDWCAIEIKHHNSIVGKLGTWWAQTVRQAGVNREPILIYKANGSKWRVRMWARIRIEEGRVFRVPADIDWNDFLAWFEKRCEVEARRSCPIDNPMLFP